MDLAYDKSNTRLQLAARVPVVNVFNVFILAIIITRIRSVLSKKDYYDEFNEL
jgi:hypothetical protein